MRARLHRGSAAGDGRIRSLLLSDAAKAELVPNRIAIYYPDDRVYWRQALSTMIKEVHDALVEAGASAGGASEALSEAAGPDAATFCRIATLRGCAAADDSQMVNVHDYGATANGAADDTDAIAAAFKAARCAGVPVFFPPAGTGSTRLCPSNRTCASSVGALTGPAAVSRGPS